MTSFKQLFGAAALVAVTTVVASAQTDFGSPLGAGAGLGGSVAPFGVPGAAGGGTARGLTGPGATGLNNARAAFANAGSNGVSVMNPAGGNVNLPQAAAQALGAVLGGTATPAQVTAFANALSGVPAGAATALANALQAFGSSPNGATLSRAIAAYNAAIDALPAGSNPPPALLAVRQALFAASAQ